MNDEYRFQQITLLFGDARQLLNNLYIMNYSDEWLFELEADAEDSSNNEFIPALKGYFRGLLSVGANGIEHVDDLDQLLIKYGFIHESN
jgi:hypothetical protein